MEKVTVKGCKFRNLLHFQRLNVIVDKPALNRSDNLKVEKSRPLHIYMIGMRKTFFFISLYKLILKNLKSMQ